MGSARGQVERDDLDARVGKVVGLETEAIAEAVVGVGNRQLDFLQPDLQRVAGLGAVDVDRAGEDVAAGAAILRRYAVEDVAQVLLHVGGLHAGLLQAGGAVGQHRVEHHRVAGVDAQHRRRAGVVVAPGDGRGRGKQGPGLARSRLAGSVHHRRQRQQHGSEGDGAGRTQRVADVVAHRHVAIPMVWRRQAACPSILAIRLRWRKAWRSGAVTTSTRAARHTFVRGESARGWTMRRSATWRSAPVHARPHDHSRVVRMAK